MDVALFAIDAEVMPGLSANQVTLCEVLEVRGSPMHEDELWAVLYQSCDALKDIFLKGLQCIYLYNCLCCFNFSFDIHAFLRRLKLHFCRYMII